MEDIARNKTGFLPSCNMAWQTKIKVSEVVRAMEVENNGFMSSDEGPLWMNQLGEEQKI